ncbi:MAG: SIMPL domain-containing protein [bacterium]|nr:SIMPL domain-containing protein [bacterium]
MRSLVNIILAPLVFFILLFAYIRLAGPIPFSISSTTTTKVDTFNVTGEGKSFVKPDTAYVTVGISASGSTVQQTQDEINSVINQVSASVKKLGIEAADIQTTNYNINPSYDYQTGRQKINGYQASTNLRIKIKDLEKASHVIDAATEAGANEVSGVTFDVADKTKAENEARQQAVTEAKKKAEEAAKIVGFTLGRIINYSENFGGSLRLIPMLQAAGGKESTDTQVEPGSSEINLTVTLSYEIR